MTASRSIPGEDVAPLAFPDLRFAVADLVGRPPGKELRDPAD
jgi:hypothetical protein